VSVAHEPVYTQISFLADIFKIKRHSYCIWYIEYSADF